MAKLSIDKINPLQRNPALHGQTVFSVCRFIMIVIFSGWNINEPAAIAQ